MLSFPDIIEPNISSADGCGDSYKISIADSTISTTTDANYKHTRPRTTRMIHTWTFSWVGMSDADYNLLQVFFETVGTFQSFSWVCPINGVAYSVRFASAFNDWQHDYPYGWHGSLKFEEV